MPKNCLPDGSCFSRQGHTAIGGRALVALDSGARQILGSIYLRNAGAPFGETGATMDLPFKNGPNPFARTGNLTLAGRKFSLLASGTPARPSTIYLDELGLHPRGVLYAKGLTVQLARFGPVYTASTNNWRRVTRARTRPVMLRQSIRYEGA